MASSSSAEISAPSFVKPTRSLFWGGGTRRRSSQEIAQTSNARKEHARGARLEDVDAREGVGDAHGLPAIPVTRFLHTADGSRGEHGIKERRTGTSCLVRAHLGKEAVCRALGGKTITTRMGYCFSGSRQTGGTTKPSTARPINSLVLTVWMCLWMFKAANVKCAKVATRRGNETSGTSSADRSPGSVARM